MEIMQRSEMQDKTLGRSGKRATKKPPKPWLSQHLRGFKKVELRGIEPLSENQFPVLLLS